MTPNKSDVIYLPKYFSRTEFVMCNPSCTLEDMDEQFLKQLDKLREYCGFPLVLSSAYRSKEHEYENGRSGLSMHCKGRAVDILCNDSYKRFVIIHNAMYCGLNGIGVYKNFIHVDNRPVASLWYGY